MKVILAICMIILGIIYGWIYFAPVDEPQRNLDCIISDACGVDNSGQLLQSEMDSKMSVKHDLSLRERL